MTGTIEIDEMASVLKCSTLKIEEALREGLLPSIQLGRPHVVPREAFFRRINEIALEQAAERRAGRAPAPVAQPAAVALVTGTRGRARRPLATLGSLT